MTQTPNLALELPAFNEASWHDDVNNNFANIDATIFSIMGITSLKGPYVNSTAVTQGDRYFDTVDGKYYEAQSAFTTEASPTTFTQERTSFPSRWELIDASEALNAATNAANSATDAAASATTAATEAANSATSATSAETEATASANSATASATSATASASSAADSATSANDSANSATASANSATAAAASAASIDIDKVVSPDGRTYDDFQTNNQITRFVNNVSQWVHNVTNWTISCVTNFTGDIQRDGVSISGQKYETHTFTYVADSTITVAHSFGANPGRCEFHIECTTANAGYSIGDVLDVTGFFTGGVESSSRGAVVEKTSSNIVIHTRGNIRLVTHGGGTNTTLTPSSWTFTVDIYNK